MSKPEKMQCKQCGAPMKTRRQCDYCGTQYYTGPEIPEQIYELPTGIVWNNGSGALSHSQTFVTTCYDGIERIDVRAKGYSPYG